jgi:2-amino-4-hydroxy-6-hydroxymethyldihydropteridine diphosphokinase
MKQSVILIGLGANLPSSRFGPPKKTLEAALEALDNRGVRVVKRSRWYSSAPVPPSGQPRYLNAVAAVETKLSPEALLDLLHAIEREFGRRRTVKNAAREIDLDLLAYGDLVRPQAPPILPHPRLAERAFVLRPICDIDPTWRHPQLRRSARELAQAAAAGADVRLCDGSDG